MTDEQLFQIKGYKDLTRRLQLAVKGIANGLAPTVACTAAGVNPARFKRNHKAQHILYLIAKADKAPAKPAASSDSDEGLSIYERAAILEKQLETERAGWTPEQREAYDPKVAADNLARAEAELKAKLEGRVCRGCAEPAELMVGDEFYCRLCREIPKPKPEPDPEPPTDAQRPVAPREPDLPSAAHRTAITTALVHDFWQRERARESERPRTPNWMDDGLPIFR